jgi:3-hydroxybutyryl-CoA dehydrogenase
MFKKISVIGAGVMGHGIAQVYAMSGYSVHLYDLKQEGLDQAINMIQSNLELFKQEGSLTEEELSKVLQRISITTDLAVAVKGADLVTEVIPEVIELKWDLFERLEELCSETTIIASNTSTFPVSRLAQKMKWPERMLITHYFNPAQLVPLVELVKHERTDLDILEKMYNFIVEIGKQPVIIRKEVPGFIANRLQAAVVREAFSLLEKGVATAEDIDLAITSGPGFRWAFNGPIKTADLGGLDTWKRVLDNLAPDLDQRQGAPEVINQLVKAGDLGSKTGKGIYHYDSEALESEIRSNQERLLHLLKIKTDRNHPTRA